VDLLTKRNSVNGVNKNIECSTPENWLYSIISNTTLLFDRIGFDVFIYISDAFTSDGLLDKYNSDSSINILFVVPANYLIGRFILISRVPKLSSSSFDTVNSITLTRTIYTILIPSYWDIVVSPFPAICTFDLASSPPNYINVWSAAKEPIFFTVSRNFPFAILTNYLSTEPYFNSNLAFDIASIYPFSSGGRVINSKTLLL
jgi:hypothetical protein